MNKNIPTHHLHDDWLHYSTLENGHPENFDKIHRHNFYEIIWFEKVNSESFLYLDFQKHQISDHQIYILFPGQVFDMKLMDEKGYVIAISTEVFDKICISEAIAPKSNESYTLSIKDQQQAKTLIDLLNQEILHRSRPNFIKSIIRSILLLITENQDIHTSNSIDQKRIEKLSQLINHHFITEKDSEFYAQKLHLTTHQLNYILRNLRATSIKKMISERLILEAKRELSYGQRSVKEIAYLLGFKDTAYFSRFFKKNTGITPDSFG